MDHGRLHQAPARLRTPRLELRFPQLEDAALLMDSVNASLGNLGFIRWAQQALDLERAQRACQRDVQQVAAGECLVYLAFEQPGAAFVGSIDLHSVDFENARCQIGYVGDLRRAGQGLMREAALAVMALGFGIGLERIEAWCDVGNTRSVHFAQALGMQREGVLRAVERDAHGRLCDQVLLSRLRTDAVPRERV
jgi:RimJ/RimL family protein N-acetyltransferase